MLSSLDQPEPSVGATPTNYGSISASPPADCQQPTLATPPHYAAAPLNTGANPPAAQS